MVGDFGGNALAAGQSGPDELVGVGPVDLGAGRAAGGPASCRRPAGARQAHARSCSGGSARRWARRCDRHGRAAARVAGSHRRAGSYLRERGRWAKVVLLSSGPRGRWTSGGRPQPGQVGSGRVDQRCCAAWEPGWDCLPLGASCVGWCTVTRASGDLPARLLHGHPSMRGGLVTSTSNTYPKYMPNKIDTSSISSRHAFRQFA